MRGRKDAASGAAAAATSKQSIRNRSPSIPQKPEPISAVRTRSNYESYYESYCLHLVDMRTERHARVNSYEYVATKCTEAACNNKSRGALYSTCWCVNRWLYLFDKYQSHFSFSFSFRFSHVPYLVLVLVLFCPSFFYTPFAIVPCKLYIPSTQPMLMKFEFEHSFTSLSSGKLLQR